MSVEARAAALELADEVLRAFHGDACARVGALLLKHADGLTLRDLRRRLPDQPDVATALVALLQHGEGRARHASHHDHSRGVRWLFVARARCGRIRSNSSLGHDVQGSLARFVRKRWVCP